MATQTRRLTSYDSGNITWSFDYDDVSMLVTAFRCVNNSARAGLGALWRPNDPTVRYEKRTEPGATDNVPVPNGQANRLQLTAVNTSHGVMLDGLDGEFQWPV